MSNSETTWFQIDAVDAWFFRDGRPSNRDEDQSDLQSLFPPPHQTLVGALRAGIAREHGWSGRGDWPDSVKAVLGDGFDDLGKLSFDGPYVALDGQPLFPAPAHVLGVIQRDAVAETVRFQPQAWLQPSAEKLSTDAGEVHLPVLESKSRAADAPEIKLKPASEFLVDVAGMNLLLNGKLPGQEHFIHQDRLFAYESRVGIQREYPSRTTGSNAMYHPTYIRLRKGVSILMGIHGLTGPWASWAPPSLLPLGGESRMATIAQVTPPTMPDSVPDGDLVVLVTPARFTGECWFGAGPDDPAAAILSESSGNVLTAAVDRPRFIGGFDSRAGSKGPLPLLPFTPPGAVWWLAENARTNSTGAPLSLGTRTAYGYGRAFVGRRISAS